MRRPPSQVKAMETVFEGVRMVQGMLPAALMSGMAMGSD